MSPHRSLGRSSVGLCRAVAPQPRGGGGFTLIELLVVITIIVILLGFIFPAYQGVQERAKKVQAKNELTQIVNAVNAYYADYGVYPIDPSITKGGFDVEYGNPDNPVHSNSELMNTLRGIDDKFGGPNAGDALNTRKVSYFNGQLVKDANKPQAGFDSKGELWDPWGSPTDANSKVGHYIVNIDANYDNVTSVYTLNYSDLTYDNTTGINGVRTGAIAASLGRDGAYGTRGNLKFKGSDDVVSWQ